MDLASLRRTYILISELYVEDMAFSTGVPVSSQIPFASDPHLDNPVTLVGIQGDQWMHPSRNCQARRWSSTANTEMMHLAAVLHNLFGNTVGYARRAYFPRSSLIIWDADFTCCLFCTVADGPPPVWLGIISASSVRFVRTTGSSFGFARTTGSSSLLTSLLISASRAWATTSHLVIIKHLPHTAHSTTDSGYEDTMRGVYTNGRMRGVKEGLTC